MRAERLQGWAAFAIAGLAALILLAALAEIGGPAEGRKERRNELRHADLVALSRYVACLSRPGMPDSLEPAHGCIQPARLADPVSGQPYRFEPAGDRRFRVCAAFDPDWRGAPYQPRIDSRGCLDYELQVDGDDSTVSARPVAPDLPG